MDFIYVKPFNMTLFLFWVFVVVVVFSVFKIGVNATESILILELLSQFLKLT